MENVHEGHRERMRQTFLKTGLEGFSDVQALEFLLQFSIPRCDTNETAHRLLDRFHGFRGVLEASIPELQDVKGVGKNSAMLIQLVRELNQRYIESERRTGKMLRGTKAFGNYLKEIFHFRKEEIAVLLCLNAMNCVQCTQILNEGSVGSVWLTTREVVEIVCREGATFAVLAHNHVTGNGLPSDSDIVATRNIYRTLRSIEVNLLDHLIFCEDEFVSMRDCGMFDNF